MNRLGKSPTILGNAKAEETYRIILSVLEILCSRHSNLRAELEILKEAIVTWRDYLNQQFQSCTISVFRAHAQAKYAVRQKIGILLEEISSYLSSITSQFQNPHLLAYRRQYEGLLRQIEWEDMPHCTGDIGVQTQPNREEAEGVLLQGGQAKVMQLIEQLGVVRKTLQCKMNLLEEMKMSNDLFRDQNDRLKAQIRTMSDTQRQYLLQTENLSQLLADIKEDDYRRSRERKIYWEVEQERQRERKRDQEVERESQLEQGGKQREDEEESAEIRETRVEDDTKKGKGERLKYINEDGDGDPRSMQQIAQQQNEEDKQGREQLEDGGQYSDKDEEHLSTTSSIKIHVNERIGKAEQESKATKMANTGKKWRGKGKQPSDLAFWSTKTIQSPNDGDQGHRNNEQLRMLLIQASVLEEYLALPK